MVSSVFCIEKIHENNNSLSTGRFTECSIFVKKITSNLNKAFNCRSDFPCATVSLFFSK